MLKNVPISPDEQADQNEFPTWLVKQRRKANLKTLKGLNIPFDCP